MVWYISFLVAIDKVPELGSSLQLTNGDLAGLHPSNPCLLKKI